MSNLSLYPKYIDKFTKKKNETGAGNGDYVMAEHINELQDAILSIESTLGINPQGESSSVAQKLLSIESGSGQGTPKTTLYKGNPININGSSSEKEAARHFSYFNQVILTDIDVDSTIMGDIKLVIAESKRFSQTTFFGQINAGMFDAQYSIEAISVMMEKWVGISIDGIYFYNFGFDQGVSRKRQNDLIDLAHRHKLKVIVNSNNIEDVFIASNKQGMNPDVISSALTRDDAILYKGFVLTNEGYQLTESLIAETQKLIDGRKVTGCKVYALGYIDDTSELDRKRKYEYAQAVAFLYSLDSFHAIPSILESEKTQVYNVIPIIENAYDPEAIIINDNGLLVRDSTLGKIIINPSDHTYSFENVKIPFKFIDLDSDEISIPWDKIDGFSFDVVGEINNYSGESKIIASKINLSNAGPDIIAALNNTIPPEEGEVYPKTDKIKAEVLDAFSEAGLNAKIVSALNENLQTMLNSGEFSANLEQLTAQYISSLNAYFDNIIVNNANITGLNAGVINVGYLSPDLLDVNSITTDKLSIHANSGLNKWTGTVVENTDLPPGFLVEPSSILGKKVYRKLEVVDSRSITTSNILPNFNDYLVMWETYIYCTDTYSRDLAFKASSEAAIFVNDIQLLRIDPTDIPVMYHLDLVPGWNHIQVVQRSGINNTTFDIGIRFSEEALKTEQAVSSGMPPTEIARVDAYATNVTTITGSHIETGSIKLDNLDADIMVANNIKSGSLSASTEIAVGPDIIISGIDGTIKTSNTTIDGTLITVYDELKKAALLIGEYEAGKFGMQSGDGSLTIDKLGLTLTGGSSSIKLGLNEDSSYNFSVDSDGQLYAKNATIEGHIVATSGVFNSAIGIGKDANNAGIVIDGSDPEDPKITIQVSHDNPLTSIIESGYVRISKLGIEVSLDGVQWTTKLHAGGLTVGTTDITKEAITAEKIKSGSITTEQLDVENVNAGLVNAGIITAMEAYINELTATTGNFEQLLSDMIVTKYLNTTNVSVYSEAKDGSGNTGFLNIDSGGMLVSSEVKVNNLIPITARLVKIDRSGIHVSENGGQTWTSKLTGAGLVVSNADIQNVSASKLISGTIDVTTNINVANKVSISGTDGIIVKAIDGPGITVKEKLSDGSYEDRILIGELSNGYGLRLITSAATIDLNKDGLSTSTGKFSINPDGTITAVEGSFAGTLSSADAVFGDSQNNVIVDSLGIVLNTGSIVDTRDLSKQALRIDSDGIIAKQGIIGGLSILAELDAQGDIIDSVITGQKKIYDDLGNIIDTVDQFTFTSDSVNVSGSEAVTINSGTLVVKENGSTYVGIGKIDPTNSKYGIKVYLHDSVTGLPTNKYIQLDQDGLRAFNGHINTIDVDKDGNIKVTGEIDATSGSLKTLSVDGVITIQSDGSLVAGDVVLDNTGLVGPNFSISSSSSNISGWEIGTGMLSSGDIILDSTNEQIKVSNKAILGKYDGINYGIKVQQGIVGGWHIDSSSLKSSNITLDSSNQIININNQVVLGQYQLGKFGLKAGDVVLDATGLYGTQYSLNSSGLTATKGLIGGWTIKGTELSSNNIHLTNSSIWIGSALATAEIILNSDSTGRIGTVQLNKTLESKTYPIYTPNFNIDLDGNVNVTGNIIANSGVFKGRVEASEGWFGDNLNGVTINSAGLSAGGVNIRGTGISVGSTLQISSSGLYLADSSSSITLGTAFKASSAGIEASAGKIANWTIGPNMLSSGAVNINSATEQITIDTNKVIIGKYDGSNYGIKADKGVIGGWEINSTSLEKTDVLNSRKTIFTDGSLLVQDTTSSHNPIDLIALRKDGSAKLGLFNVDSSGYISTTGLVINNSGAVFSGKLSAATGSFSGELNAATGSFSGRITAETGSIGGWSIDSASLYNNNVRLKSTGVISLGATEQLTLDSVSGMKVVVNSDTKFSVDLTGKMTAKNADITGKITTSQLAATGGTIGNLTINGNIVAGTVKLNATGLTGYGFSLIDTGLEATKGKIGNWTISNNTLSAGNIILDATASLEKISIGTNIVLNNDGSATIGKLSIDTDGSVSSTNFGIDNLGNASFTGTVNASSGSIIGALTVGPNIVINGSTSSIKVNTSDVVLDANGITAIKGYFGNSSNGVKVTSAGLEVVGSGSIKNAGVTINNNSIVAGDAVLSNNGLTISGITSSINLGSGNFVVTGSGALTAKSGSIAGWTVSTTSLSKNNISLNSAGSITIGASQQLVLDSLNGIKVATDKFTVDLIGNMTAKAATVTGTINAKSGYFGNAVNGIQVNTDGIEVIGTGVIKNTNTIINRDNIVIKNATQVEAARLGLLSDLSYGLSGKGFKLNESGLSLTGASNININNAFTVNSTGKMTATGAVISGNITATTGNFTGKVSVSEAGSLEVQDKVLINSDGISIKSGDITLGSNFAVTNMGNLTASNVNIAGAIDAAQGKIGEWFIDHGAIKDSIAYPKMLIAKEGIKISSGSMAEVNEITIGQYDQADPTKYGLKAGNTLLNSSGIIAKSGSIGGIVIGSDYLQSQDYSNGNSGFKLYTENGSGRIFAKDVILYGDIHANSGTFGLGSGSITADSTGIFNGSAVGAQDSSFWISSSNGSAFFKGSVSISQNSVIEDGDLIIQSGNIIAGDPFGAHAKISLVDPLIGGEISATTSTGEHIFKVNKTGAYFKGDITATTGKILGNLSIGSSGSIYIDGRNNTELGITPGLYLYDFTTNSSNEYPTFSDFPSVGELNKTYIALDTNKKYIWNAISYVENKDSRVVRLNNAGLYVSMDGGYTYNPAITGGGINANAINDGVLNITDSGSGASGISINQWDSLTNQYVENVSITPAGINVLNGAITVYSETNGEVLIGGGYLRVKGLDMGVVTSNNFIGNGNFSMVSEEYGLKQKNNGEVFLGRAQSSGGAVSNPTYHYAGWPDFGDRDPHTVYTYDINADGTINNYDPKNLDDPNHPKVARVSFNPQWVAVHPVTYHGIVPNDADNFVSIVDPDTGEVIKHLKAWKGGLYGADFTPDQAADSILKDEQGNPLKKGARMIACGDDIDRKRGPWDMVVFDTSSLNPNDWHVIGVIHVGEFPSKVVCDNKGYAYVTISLDMAVYKLDLVNMRVVSIMNATDPRGMAVSPMAIAISKDYSKIYMGGVVTDAIYEIPVEFDVPFHECRMFSVAPYPGNRGIPHDIHVLPDGRISCSSSSVTDGFVSILNPNRPDEEYTKVPIGVVDGVPRMMITNATDTWIDGTMDGEGGLLNTDGTDSMKLAYPEGITEEEKAAWNFFSVTSNKPHPDPNIKIIYATITNRCMLSILDYSSGELIEIARIHAGSNPSGVDIVVEKDKLGNIIRHKLYVAMHHFHTYPLGANKIWGYRSSDNYYTTDDLFDTGQTYYHYNPSGILVFDDGINIGRYVWVANRATDEVVIIDALDWGNQEKWVRIKDVGNKPYELKALSDNSKVFVSNDDSDNRYEPDFVTVIDRATKTIDGRIYVGDNPIGLEIKDDTYLYVACSGMKAVQKINISTRRVIDTQYVNGHPRHLKLVGNKLYVTCTDTNTISCLDANTLDPIKEFNTDGSIYEIKYPSQMELIGTKLYVTNKSSDHVVVIETATNTLSSTAIKVGSTPNAIKYNPVKNLLYVANAGEGSLCIIDPDKDEIIEWCMAGDNPEYIAVTSDGERFYVTAHGPEDIAAYGTGPFTGDAYLDNNGNTHKYGSAYWVPSRSKWVRGSDKTLTSFSSVEFWPNAELQGKKGYSHLSVLGMFDSFAQIEQDVYPMLNTSDGASEFITETIELEESRPRKLIEEVADFSGVIGKEYARISVTDKFDNSKKYNEGTDYVVDYINNTIMIHGINVPPSRVRSNTNVLNGRIPVPMIQGGYKYNTIEVYPLNQTEGRYLDGTDYIIDRVNNTIERTAGSSIIDGVAVTILYRHLLTARYYYHPHKRNYEDVVLSADLFWKWPRPENQWVKMQIDELVPKFIMVDNDQIDTFVPSYDFGKGDGDRKYYSPDLPVYKNTLMTERTSIPEYKGLSYSSMSNRASNSSVTANKSPISGNVDTIKNGQGLVVLPSGIQSVIMDIGAVYYINKLSIDYGTGAGLINNSKVEISTDGKAWEIVRSEAAAPRVFDIVFEDTFNGEDYNVAKRIRYVKVSSEGTSVDSLANNQFKQIKVMGDWKVSTSYRFASNTIWDSEGRREQYLVLEGTEPKRFDDPSLPTDPFAANIRPAEKVRYRNYYTSPEDIHDRLGEVEVHNIITGEQYNGIMARDSKTKKTYEELGQPLPTGGKQYDFAYDYMKNTLWRLNGSAIQDGEQVRVIYRFLQEDLSNLPLCVSYKDPATGKEIESLHASVAETDTTGAWVEWEFDNDYRCDWYIGWIADIGLGDIDVYLDGKIVHSLSQMATKVERFSQLTQDLKPGHHKIRLVQTQGRVNFDIIKLEDYQLFNRASTTVASPSTNPVELFSWFPSKITAEKARKYIGRGTQILSGAYDNPRTDKETKLPNNQVPIKYRVRFVSSLEGRGPAIEDYGGYGGEAGGAFTFESGSVMITDVTMEYGVNPTYWRMAPSADKYPGFMIEHWDKSDPSNTGIQTHHLAKGSVTSDKIKSFSVLDEHIANDARIQESKLDLSYDTHPHVNKTMLDSISGWGSSGVSTNIAREDHIHSELSTGRFTQDVSMEAGLTVHGVLKEVGKHEVIHRRPLYGISGDLQMQTNSYNWELVNTQYSPFGCAMPNVKTDATRYYRLYAIYGDNILETDTVRARIRLKDKVTKIVIYEWILSPTFGSPNERRDLFSEYFQASSLNNIDIELTIQNDSGTYTGIDKEIGLEWLELIAYDIYEEANN